MHRLEQLVHSLIFVVFAGYLLGTWPLPWVHSFEQLLDDARVQLNVANGIDERVVIVDIDEPSLAQLGQWPWSRSTLAKLVDALFVDYQVNVLGLDLVLAEATASREAYLLALQKKGLLQLTAAMDDITAIAPEDDALVRAMTGRNVVSGFVFKRNTRLTLNRLPEPLMRFDPSVTGALDVPRPDGFTANLPEFQQAARAVGFFDNPTVDSDGVYRRAALLQIYEGALYPSLALSVARVAISGDELVPIKLVDVAEIDNKLVISDVQVGRYLIPISEVGTVRVPYQFRQQGFAYVSAADVLTGQVDRNLLANKIVLLGTTAPGLKDIRNTPVNSQMPGVEVHASIITGILDNAIAVQPGWRLPVELILLFVTTLLLWWVYRQRKPTLSMLTTLVWLLAVVMFNLYFWQRGFLLTLAPLVLMTLTMYLLNISWELLVENYSKRRITRLFGQYVPPELVDELADISPDELLSGEEKVLTVLFSDVRGFTSLSENLSPQQLSDLMNKLLTPLTNIIHHQKGTIDKYMGDAIMAFWGAPVALENHAALAVESALMMQHSLQQIQQDLQAYRVGNLAMGIGIHTGPMSVGNMGSEFRMAYTVMGDAVNLGSRLEALTRQYGVDILVSEATTLQARGYLYLPVDRVRVKGKTESVAIYSPLSTMEQASAEETYFVNGFTSVLELYRDREWARSLTTIEALKKNYPAFHTLLNLYRERILTLRGLPADPGWDGVFTHKTKQ